jgi:hypothetical protein
MIMITIIIIIIYFVSTKLPTIICKYYLNKLQTSYKQKSNNFESLLAASCMSCQRFIIAVFLSSLFIVIIIITV